MNRVWHKHYPNHIQVEVDIPKLSLPDMLKRTSEKYPDHKALYFYGKEITYKQLDVMSD